ncbi:MAG: hypothetical protein MK185_00770 [Saccharospirillaceae bacterium]|nr:hypothetical protein [Saccharospirillaceae bacterium]
MYKEQFISAIRNLKKIRLTFYSKEDGRDLVRLCAPMDFGPSRRANDKSDRYHLWDYESDKKNHVLSLLPDQIKDMEFLADSFDPEEFVTWEAKWFVERDWGAVHS